jgi:hypothetical protein
MPYIVTTKRQDQHFAEVAEYESRRAVATLEEARQAAWRAHPLFGTTNGYAMMKARDEITLAFPDSGGTVGPLPDGTVIEVKPISWDDLRDEIPGPLPRAEGQTRQSAILDAYNARQA